MGWEGTYDVLGSAGGAMPLTFLDWNAPTIVDVLHAGGAGEFAAGAGATAGASPTAGSGYEGLGRPPAPGSRYPALGIDPAPGDPGEIARLVGALSGAAQKLGAAQDLVQRMSDDQDSWQGSAAEAFHAKLKEELPKYLKEGHESLQKAAHDLKDWESRLDGYRSRAQANEADAQSARSTFGTAWSDAVSEVRANREALALQGRHFDSDAALQQANGRIKAAMSTIEDAVKRVDNAFSTLHQAVSDAKSLADTHYEDASSVASALRQDAKDLAPHKPNPILNWIKEHGGDILSAAAAVCGVLALFCPVFAIPAILLSAGALGLHGWKMASDGAKLWPPTSADTLGNWATLGCDALGAVPGIGVTAKAAGLMKDGAEAGEAAAAATRAADGAGEAAEGSSEAAAKDPNFVQRWGAAAEERAGGDAAVNPWMQSKLSRVIDGQGKDVSDMAKMTGKMVQFNINGTGAAFATANLSPSASGNDDFLNANTAVTGAADGLAGRGAATDLADVARSAFRR